MRSFLGHFSLECSSTTSCWSGLAWYIQATPEPTWAVLIVCILHHAFSAHLFYCTFVHCRILHFTPFFAVADHRDQDPRTVAYYPLKDVATYLSRSRCRLTSVFPIVDTCLICKDRPSPTKLCNGAQMAIFGVIFAYCIFSKPHAAHVRHAF